jgi:8-oxo-dGTP diphosphatase
MTRYVLGFAFDSAGDNVVLIKKTKPAWQAGKYNGVGGKTETGEAYMDAMAREFREETNVEWGAWTYFCMMTGEDWKCACYYTFETYVLQNVQTATDEEVYTFSVQSLPETISNVPWLITAARNHNNDGGFTLEAKYR